MRKNPNQSYCPQRLIGSAKCGLNQESLMTSRVITLTLIALLVLDFATLRTYAESSLPIGIPVQASARLPLQTGPIN